MSEIPHSIKSNESSAKNRYVGAATVAVVLVFSQFLIRFVQFNSVRTAISAQEMSSTEFARNGASFTMDLFYQLAEGGVKENIIFSPFSVQICTALAYAGAEGVTAQQIAEGMKFGSNNKQEVAKFFQNVVQKYKTSELLKIANKVYVQDGKVIKPSYQADIKEHYHAEAESVNFAVSGEAAETINHWVEKKTGGKIKDLVSADALNEDTRLVLLNAVHFKGEWEKKFDESLTEEDDFWISEGETVKVEYMHKKAKFGFGFFEELGCTALEMPYKDSDLSMFVLLPEERTGLKALANKLKTVNLIDLAERMTTNEDVNVKFPKFKVEYSIELSEVFKKLHITKMFTEEAEFSNMLEPAENIYVSNILHKACIEVNEEGTEAAAATGMIMMTRMLIIPQNFDADHPFLYMIWNKKNIIFAGAFVNAPQA